MQFGRPVPEVMQFAVSRRFYESGHEPHLDDAVLDALMAASGSGCVLDPFMGSGGTLLAARRAGQPAIGIETDEALCEAAAQALVEQQAFLDTAPSVGGVQFEAKA